MIARRGLLAGGTALATVSPIGVTALPVPPDLRFDVLRNGSRIGQHNVRFRQDGTALEAAIDVNIAVRLGPIVLYRYTHLVRETWRDGGFQSLESETNDDGMRQWVRATRTPESVIVEASETPRAIQPPNAIPLTHWNNLCMERPLFNPQDGALIASRILTRGEDMVPLTDGRAVRATRYSLIGKVALDDWYDVTRLWTALRAQGRDGSTIEYRRAA